MNLSNGRPDLSNPGLGRSLLARVTHPHTFHTTHTHVHRGTQLAPQHSNIFALFYKYFSFRLRTSLFRFSVAMALWCDITDEVMWTQEARLRVIAEKRQLEYR